MLRYELAVCMVLSALPCQALAEDGGIKFAGRVSASTCEVDAASRYLLVQLGDVPVDKFTGVGTRSDSQDFKIALQCYATTATSMLTVYVRLEAQADASGRPGVLQLAKEKDAASGVGIELARLERNKEAELRFGQQIEVGQVSAAGGTLELPLRARYIQVSGTVKEGKANGRATFAVEYL